MLPVLRETDGPGIVTAMSTVLPDVDRALLTEEFGDWPWPPTWPRASGPASTAGSTTTSRSPGRGGSTWPPITVPTMLWQGTEDLMVPFAHGLWLADHVSGVTPHLLAGEGHLSVSLGALDEMFAELGHDRS